MSGFEKLPLQTERLVLRPPTPADAQAFYAIFSDPQGMRYSSTPPWTTMEQAHAYVQRAIDEFASGTSLRLVLQRRDDGQVIGQCVYYAISAQNRRAELGYSMAVKAWGRGYMNEALHAFVDYGFGELDFIRIEADIDPRNVASARSLERLGFSREGLMRDRWIVAGEVSDTGFYGLLRRDWRKT
ncbi:MAG: GNAT family N-acetyltransferase [Paucibacter sp.]|nr:GNAT family N-acetyltransferase [Roseateles sp.]